MIVLIKIILSVVLIGQFSIKRKRFIKKSLYKQLIIHVCKIDRYIRYEKDINKLSSIIIYDKIGILKYNYLEI